MLDQALCPVSAFYKVTADKFRDTSFRAQVPGKFSLIDGHETIKKPNDEDRIALAGCDGAWFKATWELYLLRQKYRETLAQWRSDTGGGGGGGEVESFQNCCQIREKWLTYVYMLDVEASLLLASNASSAVPTELLYESGYQQQAAHLGRSSNSTTKQLNGAALIQATEECSKNINRVADLMATLVEKKTSASNSVMSTPTMLSSTPPPSPRSEVWRNALMTFAGFANMGSRSWMTLALVQIQST
jgi:hypothetical protein